MLRSWREHSSLFTLHFPFRSGSWQTSNALALQASLCGSVTHRLHHPSLGTRARRGFQAKDVLHRLGEGGLSTNRAPSYGWQAMFYVTYPNARLKISNETLKSELTNWNDTSTTHHASLNIRIACHFGLVTRTSDRTGASR